jgi:hypothetical protein
MQLASGSGLIAYPTPVFEFYTLAFEFDTHCVRPRFTIVRQSRGVSQCSPAELVLCVSLCWISSAPDRRRLRDGIVHSVPVLEASRQSTRIGTVRWHLRRSMYLISNISARVQAIIRRTERRCLSPQGKELKGYARIASQMCDDYCTKSSQTLLTTLYFHHMEHTIASDSNFIIS